MAGSKWQENQRDTPHSIHDLPEQATDASGSEGISAAPPLLWGGTWPEEASATAACISCESSASSQYPSSERSRASGDRSHTCDPRIPQLNTSCQISRES